MTKKARNRLFQKVDRKIQASFLRLSRHLPIEKISVSAICKEVGINRSSFYYHYQDIYDLLDQIVIQTNHGLAEKMLSDNNSFLPESNLLIYLYHIRENQDLYRIIHSSRNHFPMEYYYQEMLDYLKQEEKFSDMADIHLSHILVFLQAGFVHTIRHWLETGCEEKPEVMLKVIRKFL